MQWRFRWSSLSGKRLCYYQSIRWFNKWRFDRCMCRSSVPAAGITSATSTANASRPTTRSACAMPAGSATDGKTYLLSVLFFYSIVTNETNAIVNSHVLDFSCQRIACNKSAAISATARWKTTAITRSASAKRLQIATAHGSALLFFVVLWFFIFDCDINLKSKTT